MDTRKTRKMAATEKELAEANKSLSQNSDLIRALGEYKPEFADGKSARTSHLQRLDQAMAVLRQKIGDLNSRLEVETIDMLAGVETDFEEPTPADALRDAS